MNEMTKRQQEYYDFISDFIDANGSSPTQAEMSQHFSCRPNNTFKIIQELIKKGFVMKKDKYKTSGIVLNYDRRKTASGSAYNNVADALLSILESRNEVFIPNLTDDLRLFVNTGRLRKYTEQILNTLIEASKPTETFRNNKPHIPFEDSPGY